ncbi:MAG: NifB/NifX family molybdenum-iron cluster-binding protein [Candidatus Stygibacter frigidus]|nr:NifB/NifX family molybdenum-iron cluster-binding protein [Candidatus Stygibacter frigidus]
MLIAIPEWNKRISPVFDEALNFKFYQINAGEIIEIADQALPKQLVGRQMQLLSEAGVDILICGAISRQMQREAIRSGIEVIAFLAGDTDLVIKEWMSGTWQQEHYCMPGCGRNQRRGNRERKKHSRR